MTWRQITSLSVVSLLATSVAAQEFGGAEDLDWAYQLWQTMETARMVESDAIQALPYSGGEPHGAVLQTFYATISVGGESGVLVVKRNYGPGDVTADTVLTDPEQRLAAVTIMFRRAKGYAPESGDWFWAKYLSDGSLDQGPDETPSAGRVAGCIQCHGAAPGDDYLFTTDAALD